MFLVYHNLTGAISRLPPLCGVLRRSCFTEQWRPGAPRRHPANPAIWKSGSPMKKSIVLWKNWEKWGKSHENYMFSGGKSFGWRVRMLQLWHFPQQKKSWTTYFETIKNDGSSHFGTHGPQTVSKDSIWNIWINTLAVTAKVRHLISQKSWWFFWVPLDTIGYPMKIMKASSLCTSQHVDWFIVSPGLNHRPWGGGGE